MKDGGAEAKGGEWGDEHQGQLENVGTGDGIST